MVEVMVKVCTAFSLTVLEKSQDGDHVPLYRKYRVECADVKFQRPRSRPSSIHNKRTRLYSLGGGGIADTPDISPRRSCDECSDCGTDTIWYTYASHRMIDRPRT